MTGEFTQTFLHTYIDITFVRGDAKFILTFLLQFGKIGLFRDEKWFLSPQLCYIRILKKPRAPRKILAILASWRLNWNSMNKKFILQKSI